MENFYDLLKITQNANKDEIINAYKSSIKHYIDMSYLDNDKINEIKTLKSALYVLTNDNLKNKYDTLLIKANMENTSSTDNELSQHNDTNYFSNITMNQHDNNISTLFNVDNSWMNTHNITNNNTKKNKIETNIISDRIFSLQEINKKPLYPVKYKINENI